MVSLQVLCSINTDQAGLQQFVNANPTMVLVERTGTIFSGTVLEEYVNTTRVKIEIMRHGVDLSIDNTPAIGDGIVLLEYLVIYPQRWFN